MAKSNYSIRLQQLLEKELSLNADENSCISGYQSLIELLKTPKINQHLHGYHEQLFECLSRIVSKRCHRYFEDEQLIELFELASNSRVLTMSQNQILDSWHQNVDERNFRTLHDDDDDDEENDNDRFEHSNESADGEEKSRSPTPGVRERSPEPISSFVKSNRKQINTATLNKNESFSEIPVPHKIPKQAVNNSCGPMVSEKSLMSTLPEQNLRKGKQKQRNQEKLTKTSEKSAFNKSDELKFQQIYNNSSSLINCGQTNDQRNKTFLAFCSLVKELHEKNAEELTKRFRDKEENFFILVCHVAQNESLFSQEQYNQIFDLKEILLVKKHNELHENRSVFSRRRSLVPLNTIEDSWKSTSQVPMPVFNDLQEYVIRSQPPISSDLFQLIKNLLKSTVQVDADCFEYFKNEIIFGTKKFIFADLQIEELRSCIAIRNKRNERSKQNKIWKQRLLLLREENLKVNLDQWIEDFEMVLSAEQNDAAVPSSSNLDHSIWYFGVLSMTSSGHLNQEQFQKLLDHAIQSPLFNQTQKFYFNFYLKSERFPITLKELRSIQQIFTQNQVHQKKSAYEQLESILQIPKPIFIPEQSSAQLTVSSSDTLNKDSMPIVDEHLTHTFVSILTLICQDKENFPNRVGQRLVDQLMERVTIFYPLPKLELKKLAELKNEILTLPELKSMLLAMDSDLTNLIKALSDCTLENSDDCLEFLTISFLNIFQDRNRFSDEQCRTLNGLIEKHVFGKRLYHIINTHFEKYRLGSKKVDLSSTSLNKFLQQVLNHNHQAAMEFLNLLEKNLDRASKKKTSIDGEINQSLLKNLILTIVDQNQGEFQAVHLRLKDLINRQNEFFLTTFNKEFVQMIEGRLEAVKDQLEILVETIKLNFNRDNFKKLMNFIENQLSENAQFNKLVEFILSTFDVQNLPKENVLQLIRRTHDHSRLKNQSIKQNMKFLMDLLDENVYASPKSLRSKIKSQSTSPKALRQIIIILRIPTGQYAPNKWKNEMVELLLALHSQDQFQQEISSVLEHSPMLGHHEWKNKLKCYFHRISPTVNKKSKRKQGDNPKIQASSQPASENIKTKTESSEMHRKMFQFLLSDNPDEKNWIINQCQKALFDEKLPPLILLPKFIQALEIIIKTSEQQNARSLNRWKMLIEKNRGKIFTDDAQCDELLFLILIVSMNEKDVHKLSTLSNLIQSNVSVERNEGFSKYLKLLRKTQIVDRTIEIKTYPTIADEIYHLLKQIIYMEYFNTQQVQQCLQAAKNSWLLREVHRQQIQNF